MFVTCSDEKMSFIVFHPKIMNCRGPQLPARSDLAESETLVESDGVGEVDVGVAAAIVANIETFLSTVHSKKNQTLSSLKTRNRFHRSKLLNRKDLKLLSQMSNRKEGRDRTECSSSHLCSATSSRNVSIFNFFLSQNFQKCFLRCLTRNIC